MGEQLTPGYKQTLADYLKTNREEYLYQVAQLGKELMKQGMGPEAIVEMHLNAVKEILKEKTWYSKEAVDSSFAFLIEGLTAYGMAYKEYLDSRTEGYLAQIRELNKSLKERLTEVTTLYETVKAASSSLDLNAVISLIFENAVKILKAGDGSLMLLDPEEGVLIIKKAYGLSEDIIRKTKIKVGEGVAGAVAQSGEPLLIRGKKDKAIIHISGRKKYDEANSICVPLKSKKGVIGVINVNQKEDSEPFTDDDLKLLSTIAHEAASAIENAHLFKEIQKELNQRKQAEEALRRSEEDARRLAHENEIMAEIGQIFSSTLNIEEIYERFAEEVRKLLPFDRIAINIINPKDQTLTIAYVTGVEIEGRKTGDTIPLAGSLTEEVLRTRSSFLTQSNDKEELARRFPRLLPSIQAKFKSLLSAPLFSKDQVIGVLHIRSTKSNVYTERDLKLAERVGQQIAGAIANTQLFVERKRAEGALHIERQRF